MENHLIYEICAIVATIVFVIIAFYFVKTLIASLESLKHIKSSLSQLESKIEPISNETIRLLENSNEIAESIQDKLSDLDPVMGSIANLGSALENATESFGHNGREHHYKFYHSEKKSDWNDIVANLIRLASMGVETWQKIKKGR